MSSDPPDDQNPPAESSSETKRVPLVSLAVRPFEFALPTIGRLIIRPRLTIGMLQTLDKRSGTAPPEVVTSSLLAQVSRRAPAEFKDLDEGFRTGQALEPDDFLNLPADELEKLAAAWLTASIREPVEERSETTHEPATQRVAGYVRDQLARWRASTKAMSDQLRRVGLVGEVAESLRFAAGQSNVLGRMLDQINGGSAFGLTTAQQRIHDLINPPHLQILKQQTDIHDAIAKASGLVGTTSPPEAIASHSAAVPAPILMPDPPENPIKETNRQLKVTNKRLDSVASDTKRTAEAAAIQLEIAQQQAAAVQALVDATNQVLVHAATQATESKNATRWAAIAFTGTMIVGVGSLAFSMLSYWKPAAPDPAVAVLERIERSLTAARSRETESTRDEPPIEPNSAPIPPRKPLRGPEADPAL